MDDALNRKVPHIASCYKTVTGTTQLDPPFGLFDHDRIILRTRLPADHGSIAPYANGECIGACLFRDAGDPGSIRHIFKNNKFQSRWQDIRVDHEVTYRRYIFGDLDLDLIYENGNLLWGKDQNFIFKPFKLTNHQSESKILPILFPRRPAHAGFSPVQAGT
jgi:hypothetical protein